MQHTAHVHDTIRAIIWEQDTLRLLDQRRLPQEHIYLDLQDAAGVAAAIHDMVVRGAPAIGITAAYGVVLSAMNHSDRSDWRQAVAADIERLAASRPGSGIRLDGLVILGPNVVKEAAFVSGRYAELTEDPDGRLAILKTMGAGLTSLDLWLTVQEYVIQTFRKFGSDIGALRQYGHDIVEPMLSDPDIFYEWTRTALETIPVVRCVFAEENAHLAEEILSRHLEENILGPRFSEDMVRIASVHPLKAARIANCSNNPSKL